MAALSDEGSSLDREALKSAFLAGCGLGEARREALAGDAEFIVASLSRGRA